MTTTPTRVRVLEPTLAPMKEIVRSFTVAPVTSAGGQSGLATPMIRSPEVLAGLGFDGLTLSAQIGEQAARLPQPPTGVALASICPTFVD